MVILPYHHPVRVAERVAMVDHMSGGRVEFGTGRSTAYELVHTGDIPSLRLGRRIVVPVGRIADKLGVENHAVLSAAV